MKKRTRIALAAAVLAGFAASVYLGPCWTLYRMKAAIAARDADGLARRIDFPALRQSAHDQFGALMKRQMVAVGEQMKAGGASDEMVADWRKVMPTAPFDAALDQMVSPEGVAAMLSGAAPAGTGGADDAKPLELHLAYRGLNQAVFRTGDGQGEGLVFSRAGLWSWKLTGIDLAQDARS